ncbi:transglutaminase domain-containing protein [Paenibacillus algorifonticola]|nr:transglutaminase domain-containing protein [Paenibacillus algorifonticola]
MMRFSIWKPAVIAAAVLGTLYFTMKPEWLPVFAASEQQGQGSGTISQLEQEMAAHFKNREEHFTLQYNGDSSKLSAELKSIIDRAMAKDDYTAYILESYVYTTRSLGTRSTIKMEASYRESKEQTAEVDRVVAQQLKKLVTPGMNDHLKVKAIHDWIAGKLRYDQSLTQYTAYEALTTGSAVCQGYALLAYKMLSEAGITTRIAEGTVDTGDHAWNMVKLGGYWYHLDVTWDDPVSTDPAAPANTIQYSYYLKTDKEMRHDHQWKKSYPAANTSYSAELDKLEKKGGSAAASYKKLGQQLGFQWLKPENIVADRAALTEKIRAGVKRGATSLEFRYMKGDTFSADLKSAVAALQVPIGYSARYEPYLHDGSQLVKLQLTY